MDAKEKIARLLLASTETPASDTPPVPAGLAEQARMMEVDLPVVRRILTAAYTVRPNLRGNGICCTSRTGIDDDTEGPFDAVMTAFRKHFGARLLEVDHATCHRHVDFTIYLRQTA